MKIGTLVFTYHRSKHTKAVIHELSKNDIHPEKLYIFQDGIKESTNCDEWEKVNRLIHHVDWCETEVHVSERNQGLAKSIVSGINHVMKDCDAVIVLEDDCVPHRQFMRFMVSALNNYAEEKKVYSVSGYAWDVELSSQKEDAYFNGRICSYGWGTWKDRWSQYEEDYRILNKIKREPMANARLQLWGQDLAGMVAGNVLGQCDSWAVFWALKVIEKGGYCLSPYRQLVHNIGFDGSGVHCAAVRENSSQWGNERTESFVFPAKVEIASDCEDEFHFLFSGKHGEEKMKLYRDVLLRWIEMKQQGKMIMVPEPWKEGIAVWGRGKIFDCLLSELKGRAQILYIIESKPSVDEYKGIPVVSASDLPESVGVIVVIPYFDLGIITNKVKKKRPEIELIGIDQLLTM